MIDAGIAHIQMQAYINGELLQCSPLYPAEIKASTSALGSPPAAPTNLLLEVGKVQNGLASLGTQLNTTVSIIIAGGVETANAAALVAARLDPDGRMHKSNKNREDNDIRELRSGHRLVDFFDLANRSVSDTGAYGSTEILNRVSTENLYPFTIGETVNLIILPGYTVSVYRFNPSQVYQSSAAYTSSATIVVSDPFIRFKFQRADNANLTPQDVISNVFIITKPSGYLNAVTGLIGTGRNNFDQDNPEVTVGFISNASGAIDAGGTQYKTTGYIPVFAGKSYKISPKCRKLLAYDLYGTPIAASYVTDEQTNYTFTAIVDGSLRVSYRIVDEGIFQIEEGTVVTPYAPYRKQFVGEIALNDYQLAQINKNPLCGEIVFAFGNSIMEASGNGFAHMIAAEENMILYMWAAGGALVANVGTNNLHVQISEAIASGITPDYILFEGQTNDIHINNNIPLGDISSGYDATLDETTFSGAFESFCKKLTINWPAAKKLYIRVHNMLGRDAAKQVTYGERALVLCRKWAMQYKDMYSEGGLNTCIPEILALYADENGVHPTVPGHAIFYKPRVKAAMLTM